MTTTCKHPMHKTETDACLKGGQYWDGEAWVCLTCREGWRQPVTDSEAALAAQARAYAAGQGTRPAVVLGEERRPPVGWVADLCGALCASAGRVAGCSVVLRGLAD
jgi:hypothetical protein